MYKVYAKLDEKNQVVGIESTAFNTEQELLDMNFVLLDEGEDGSTYGHAQSNYLNLKHGCSMFDKHFRPNFKFENGKLIALSDTEKTDPSEMKAEPTAQEQFNAKILKELATLKTLVMKAIANV